MLMQEKRNVKRQLCNNTSIRSMWWQSLCLSDYIIHFDIWFEARWEFYFMICSLSGLSFYGRASFHVLESSGGVVT